MSDVSHGPPSAGWYALGGNPEDLVYFDGQLWTWRRWRPPGGDWHQEPLLPPLTTLPPPLVPPAAGAPGPWGPPGGAAPGPPGSGRPPGWGPARGAPSPYGAGHGQWGAAGYPGAPYGPGGPWFGAPSAPTGRLDLHLPEPERQARWKTLLRALLVLPNLVALWFVEIAVAFVTIILWFAALFTARVPERLWQFSKGVLQWQARTYAYTYFLTDRYPPYEFGDAAHPVSVTLERPDRFNRLAVLFRVILVIPAALVAGVYTYGAFVFAVVTWLVTLVTGRCPRPLHLMLAAWLRYQLRYQAYYGLLTTEYPSAALGDRQTTHGTLQSGEIVLRGASKAFAVIALVLGAVLYVTQFAFTGSLDVRAQARVAIIELQALRSRDSDAEARFRDRVDACSSTWRCVDRQTTIVADNLDTQLWTIRGISFPTQLTRSDAGSVLVLLREERGAVSDMQVAATRSAYEQDLNRVVALTRSLQPLVLKLESDLASAS